jgi:sugar phosphate isomerase/epimerase
MNWYGGSPPPTSRFSRFSTDVTLRMCEEMGAVAATAIGQGSDDVALDQITDSFGTLCDRAAGFGMQVQLEFTAIHAIRTLRMAWDIVRAADRANGGIVFDTWHFFRTEPDYALLAQIPGDRIFSVQVDDALPNVVGTMRDDTLNRLMPGDGSMDLRGALAALDAIGGLTWVGPEVISPVTAAMDPVEAAGLGRKKIEDIIAEVRSS